MVKSANIRHGLPIILALGVVFAALAGFALYTIDVDGSLLGSLWQSARGNEVEYGGLRASLPRYWIAVPWRGKLWMIRFGDGKTEEVVFWVLPHHDRKRWEQNRMRWADGQAADFVRQGYHVEPPPSVLVLGEPATCVRAVSKEDGGAEIHCGTADGQFLLSYFGPEEDVRYFISIIGSIQPTSAH
jgi:hypothetical protein